VSEGQQLSPGDVIHQPVTFTPTAQGTQTAVYSITGDDGQGAVAVQLTGTGVTGTGTTNVAAGKPATASSTQQNYGPGNVTDATPTPTGNRPTTPSRNGSRSTWAPRRASAS
jgi:hypothetical protein